MPDVERFIDAVTYELVNRYGYVKEKAYELVNESPVRLFYEVDWEMMEHDGPAAFANDLFLYLEDEA